LRASMGAARTLTVLRKGGKLVTMPLAPRVARAIDLPSANASTGQVFVDKDGQRLDRHAAGRIVRQLARHSGMTNRVGPHIMRVHHRRVGRWTPAA
jgi:integrase/recombinase XerD